VAFLTKTNRQMSKQFNGLECLDRTRDPLGSAFAVLFFLLAVLPVNAQQINGDPGSPSATTTINGKYLPAQPSRIKDAGGIRTQFHHMIDIVPTILEATGIQAPVMVNGIAQKPIEGVSMAYTRDKENAKAPSKRETQYFEMFGNRAIYRDGWISVAHQPSDCPLIRPPPATAAPSRQSTLPISEE
jgi:hypothetical protein